MPQPSADVAHSRCTLSLTAMHVSGSDSARRHDFWALLLWACYPPIVEHIWNSIWFKRKRDCSASVCLQCNLRSQSLQEIIILREREREIEWKAMAPNFNIKGAKTDHHRWISLSFSKFLLNPPCLFELKTLSLCFSLWDKTNKGKKNPISKKILFFSLNFYMQEKIIYWNREKYTWRY